MVFTTHPVPSIVHANLQATRSNRWEAVINEILRNIRFFDWQQTIAGERVVIQTLRRVLLKYQLHKEQGLFDKAYGYIKEYY